MNGGASALQLSGDSRRRASLVLGVFSVLIAVLALITATRGPAAISSALPGGLAEPAVPPKPVAQIAITAAGDTPLNPAVPLSVEVQHGTLQTVQVIDSKTGKPVTGALATGSASWHTTSGLSYGDSYQ
ncbi:MAG TPA: Ig-like domain-containing protein, partial [Pseudonocardia sp.]|nr:Ig-like domain-containing protein [Pseudonocardia sp.]